MCVNVFSVAMSLSLWILGRLHLLKQKQDDHFVCSSTLIDIDLFAPLTGLKVCFVPSPAVFSSFSPGKSVSDCFHGFSLVKTQSTVNPILIKTPLKFCR